MPAVLKFLNSSFVTTSTRKRKINAVVRRLIKQKESRRRRKVWGGLTVWCETKTVYLNIIVTLFLSASLNSFNSSTHGPQARETDSGNGKTQPNPPSQHVSCFAIHFKNSLRANNTMVIQEYMLTIVKFGKFHILYPVKRNFFHFIQERLS